MSRALFAVTLFMISIDLFAGEYCREKVKELIFNGNIYFKTSKTCDGWCQLPAGWSDEAKNRAFSMLLAARTQDREMTFFWPQFTSSCEKKLAPYESPTILYY